MFCKKCGSEIADGSKFCEVCGAPVEETVVTENVVPHQTHVTTPNNGSEYQRGYKDGYESGRGNVPPEYIPPSPLGFFGLTLLYNVPIVGLVFLIIHSLQRGNLARRNYARSYWVPYIILAVIGLVVLIIYLISGTALFGGIKRLN